MSQPAAFCHTGTYPAAPPQEFRMPQHYLLYATRGTMRLEAEGRGWMLPPARAALITADQAISVTLVGPLEACSALFDAGLYPAPATTLSVFEVTPLLRELLTACAPWTVDASHAPSAATLFAALQTVAWDLAASPSPVDMPLARTEQVRRALDMTGAQMGEDVSFDQVASQVAMSPRNLSRRFQSEIGMTWRAALRRMRIIRAMERLADPDARPADVAFSVGYNSLSAFNAAFREISGTSPAAFQKRCAAAPLMD